MQCCVVLAVADHIFICLASPQEKQRAKRPKQGDGAAAADGQPHSGGSSSDDEAPAKRVAQAALD
jgi:hypothetical protein